MKRHLAGNALEGSARGRELPRPTPSRSRRRPSADWRMSTTLRRGGPQLRVRPWSTGKRQPDVFNKRLDSGGRAALGCPMPHKIFFSWQSDVSTTIGRNLIERALQQALKRIAADAEIEIALRDVEIDRDTKGVPGTPPIIETIFKKIDLAAVFLPDLTFVGKRLDERPTPNPNVLIEYGWALKSRGHSRMVPVMNTAFGAPKPETMPFDMGHLKHPIQYNCPEGASDDDRQKAKETLSKDLEGAIRAILTDPELTRIPAPPQQPPFNKQSSQNGLGRFRKQGELIGVNIHNQSQVLLRGDANFWLRVMPQFDPGRTWSIAELEAAYRSQPSMQPLTDQWRGLSYVRGYDGCGVYEGNSTDSTNLVSYIFRSGEIWSIDARVFEQTDANGQKAFALDEIGFARSLIEYTGIIRRLGIVGPIAWIAGVEGIKNHVMYPDKRPGYISIAGNGPSVILADQIVVEGIFDEKSSAIDALKPFFERVYETAALTRPAWADGKILARLPNAAGDGSSG